MRSLAGADRVYGEQRPESVSRAPLRGGLRRPFGLPFDTAGRALLMGQ